VSRYRKRTNGGLCAAIHSGFAPEKPKKEELLPIEWGKYPVYGGIFLVSWEWRQKLITFQ
jgi:hypothetical protein